MTGKLQKAKVKMSQWLFLIFFSPAEQPGRGTFCCWYNCWSTTDTRFQWSYSQIIHVQRKHLCSAATRPQRAQARRQRRETPQHHHSALKTTRPFQKTASLILVHIIIKTNQAWAIWITSPGFRHAGGKFGGSQWKYDSDGLRSMATFVI